VLQGPASPWAALLAALPPRTETPLLWADRSDLLQGSPVLAQAEERAAALAAEWEALAAAAAAGPERLAKGGAVRAEARAWAGPVAN
jgi:hypothetical protein